MFTNGYNICCKWASQNPISILLPNKDLKALDWWGNILQYTSFKILDGGVLWTTACFREKREKEEEEEREREGRDGMRMKIGLWMSQNPLDTVLVMCTSQMAPNSGRTLNFPKLILSKCTVIEFYTRKQFRNCYRMCIDINIHSYWILGYGYNFYHILSNTLMKIH